MIAAFALAVGLLADPFVIDGDTIGDAATGARYRVAGLDAPEIWSAHCPSEKQAGERAAAAAGRLVYAASKIEIIDTGARSGRRIVAHVRIDGRDFADAMIASGHGRRWPSQTGSWCSRL